jgi:hypothetical protein
MFGNVLSIKLVGNNENLPLPQDKPNNPIKKGTAAPFPLIIAPPNYGPWYQKPPQKSYLKPSAASPPKIKGTKWAQLMTNKLNPPSSEVSVENSSLTNKNQQSLFQKKHSSSLHTLLSPKLCDPLFDDDHADGQTSGPEIEREKYFHCDDALPSWVWAPSVFGDGVHSNAERELYNTLKLGRASHGKLPLLAVVSSPIQPLSSNGDKSLTSLDQTNLNVLYRSSNIAVTDTSTGDQAGSYTLYHARHPSLAPLISVNKCFDSRNDTSSILRESDPMESFISVFDITPSRHRPLHEMLRTSDFLTKPLYPGVEGHASEVECEDSPGFLQKKSSDQKSPFAWFNAGGDDQGLCRCRKLFDRGRGEVGSSAPLSNLLQRERNFRAELRQFTSSTSTMFSVLAEQEIFDDLRKMNLLPQSSHQYVHPQLYSRFYQTRMLYRVGTAYHADVADLRIRFLALQLFHAVNFLHSKGVTLGDQLRPDRIFIEDDDLWLRLVVPVEFANKNIYASRMNGVCNDTAANEERVRGPTTAPAFTGKRAIFDRYGSEHDSRDRNTETICQQKATIIPYPGYGLLPCAQWQSGLLTNFAYLMMINAAAGRYVFSS